MLCVAQKGITMRKTGVVTTSDIVQLRRILEDLRDYIAREDQLDLGELTWKALDDLKARKTWLDNYIGRLERHDEHQG